MIRLVFLLFLSAPGFAQSYDFTSRPGASVYTYGQSIDEAANGRWTTDRPAGRIEASEAEILRFAPFSGFHRLGSHRALALGHPETCPFSVRAAGFSSPRLAVANALEQCLIRVSQFDAYQPARCGCRLAIVDDLIVGRPAQTLKVPRFIPAAFTVGGRDILGVLRHSGWRGSDMPISFTDARGTKRCEGVYSMGALVVNNAFTLTCDFYSGALSGTVSVRDITSGNPWGAYQGQSAGGERVSLTIAKPLGHP